MATVISTSEQKLGNLDKFHGFSTLQYYKFTKFTIDLKEIKKYFPLIVDILLLTTPTDPIKTQLLLSKMEISFTNTALL